MYEFFRGFLYSIWSFIKNNPLYHGYPGCALYDKVSDDKGATKPGTKSERHFSGSGTVVLHRNAVECLINI